MIGFNMSDKDLFKLASRPTRRMIVGVYGIDDETGEQFEIVEATYVDVPKGCRVLVRCRAWKSDGPQMLPFEFDSEKWSQDPTMKDVGGDLTQHYGLWGNDVP
jgi:hypothetical protein